MLLMTLEEFKRLPNYTLFSVMKKKDLDEWIDVNLEFAEGPYIKTGAYTDGDDKPRWNGVIDLFPSTVKIDEKRLASNWSSWDNADGDYCGDDYRFIVFEPREIIQMMKILLVALKTSNEIDLPDGETWFANGAEIKEDDIFEEAGIDKEKFDYGTSDGNFKELLRDFVKSMDGIRGLNYES